VTRIDYLDDPNAPKATTIIPAVSAVVTNDSGELLLVHKTDNDLWALPGGAIEPGESAAEAVTREVREETGYDVEVVGLVGVYSNPRHVVAYDDGEVRQQFSICFTTRLLGGDSRTSNETKDVRWVQLDQLHELNIHPSMRARIGHYLERRERPYIG
jgi:ADP-ribose pyrophosphatase YjhB (NUDIX family)